jgi:hypothetical protein
MFVRIDLILSYWIFLWFILYILKFTTYNPKFIILVGIIENTLMILYLLYIKVPIINIFILLTSMIILKILPLYYIYNTKFQIKDVYLTFFIIIIYILWLKLNNTNIINTYKHIINSYKLSIPDVPSLYIYNKLKKLFYYTFSYIKH